MIKETLRTGISPAQEEYLLQTRFLVRRIIFGKMGKSHYDSVEDVEQRVFLRLWKWKFAHGSERDLTEEEWLRFANVVAHHEVSDFFASRNHQPIAFSQLNKDAQAAAETEPSDNSRKSSVEARSLLALVWRLAQKLTLRQRYAYFLRQPDFLIDFIVAGCCGVKGLADFFDITEEDFSVILEAYPLSDEKIAVLLEKKLGKKFSVPGIWKSRSKGKAAIAKKLAGYIFDERLSDRKRDRAASKPHPARQRIAPGSGASRKL